MKFKIINILLISVLCANFSFGQSDLFKGNYPVHNYTNDDFNSPTQIRAGNQVDRGVYLFGNSEKIIRFDGADWSFVKLDDKNNLFPNKKDEKTVYKIFSSSDKTTYVARKNSLSIIGYDSLGKHVYRPFYYDEKLEDVWSITETLDNEILFFTKNHIIKYDPTSRKIADLALPIEISRGNISFGIPCEEGVFVSVTYAYDDKLVKTFGRGVLYFLSYKDLSFSEVKNYNKTSPPIVLSYFKIDDKDYLLDEHEGVLPVTITDSIVKIESDSQNPFDDLGSGFTDALFHNDYLWLATDKNGFLIVNKSGQIVREFGELEGVQDLYVYTMFFDQNNNLWLLLDNGISVVEFSSPVSVWQRNEGVIGAIESVEFYKDEILLSSRTNGILKSKRENNRKLFEETKAINETTYDIEIIYTEYGVKKLVVGYSGIYELIENGTKAELIADGVYAWSLIQSSTNKNEVYVGGEGFFGKLIFDGKEWIYKEIKSVESDVRSFTKLENDLYFSVKGEGIYRLSESGDLKLLPFDDEVNLKDSDYYIENYHGKVYAGCNSGLLQVDKDIVRYANVVNRNIKGEGVNVHRLLNHPKKDELWAVIFFEENDITIKEIGFFTKNKDGDIEWNRYANPILEKGVIYDIKYHNDILYFGTGNGLLALDRESFYMLDKDWEVYLTSVYYGDSLLSYIPEESKGIKPLKHGSLLRFNFASASFYNNGEVEYRARLVGYTNEWSSYELVNFKEYEKLPYGTYTLEVQGRNYYSKESKVYRFTFTVLPPWYFTWWAFTVYGVLAILILLISSRIAIYRVRQKNKRLEELVALRTNEIAAQNETLEQQKSEIESKNEDILDSIKYAKRIQDTILPSKERLDGMLKEHFVMYIPKDIVSGDFYWAKQIGNKAIWSAIDCTGHGVPGALVSIVGNNGLLRATSEFGLTEPAKILDKTRELVVESFKNQGSSGVRDGMDMALVTMDMDTLSLDYAGANNSCVIVRNKEIIEIKADKQPIGDFEKSKPFTNHTIQLEKNDCIYLFSDGYVDQFGGPKGKKFKSRPFKEFLVEINDMSMEKQHDALLKRFHEWMEGYEQIDDVCVFGVRV